MPRNIFLSFLGITAYKPVRYYIESVGQAPQFRVEKYVQKTLLDHLSRTGFGPGDAAFIFLTDMARDRNWEAGSGELRLKTLLNGAYEFSVQDISVPDRSSEEAIWETFLKVYHCIQPGDRVYLDITYSWRYLPMLGATLLNYAKALKKISVEAIYYGALERLAPHQEIDRILPEDTRWTPVLNLAQFSELQDWAAAAYDFVQYGYPERWNTLTASAILEKNEPQSTQSLKSINDRIQLLAALLRTNRGKELHRFRFDELKNLLLDFSGQDNFLKPLDAIIGAMSEKMQPFSDADPLRWLEQVNWCRKHQLWQQGVTQLQEGFLTWLCEYFEAKGIAAPGFFQWDKSGPRGVISGALNVCRQQLPEDKWTGSIQKHKNIARQIVQFDVVQDLAEAYYQLSGIRNDISHSGYTKNTRPEKFAELLDRYYLQFHQMLTQGMSRYLEQEKPTGSRAIQAASAGLLNLSNHPSAAWSQDQLQAATTLYGAIEDLPFPAIPPDADSGQVQQLAREYFEQVTARQPAAVHLMGEMTFTFHLVQLLREAGIPCIASTTERIAEEREGQKIVTFRFVQFRAY